MKTLEISASRSSGVRNPKKHPRKRESTKFSLSNSKLLSCVMATVRSLPMSEKTPILKRFKTSLKNGNWLAMTGYKVDPFQYEDSESFAVDYLVSGLLKKSEHLPIDTDRVATALSKWHEAEDTCRWVNRHNGIDPFECNRAEGDTLSTTLEATIWLARVKIAQILGRFSWDEAYASFGFSGGASTRLKRRNGHPFYKYSGKPEVTRDAALLAICAIWTFPMWKAQMQEAYGDDPQNWVTIVEGSNVTTVRKTALTDRVIAIEPDMNMFMQKGVGAVIRRRLKKVGVDLNDQSINQRLALIGSRTGSLATIDLQSASDSVSMSLVEQLLPSDWLTAVKRLRCEVCTLPNGVKHRLEKVSSMGNGFTFELESLIFWALSSASVEILGVSDKRIGIYGDDIVVHAAAADHLIRVLGRCGFTTNKEKSFVSGPFRESCGKHYFYGADVSPFYVKSQTDDLSDLYWFANSYRSWVGRLPAFASQQAYTAMVDLCRQKAKGRLCYVPEALGPNSGLICNFDEYTPVWIKDEQCFETHRLVPVRQEHCPTGVPALLAWFAKKSEHREIFDAWYNDADQDMVVELGDTRYVRRGVRLSWWCTTSSEVVLPSRC